MIGRLYTDWGLCRYATDEQAFFADFSQAFSKLIELGVPEQNFGGKAPFELKKLDEQDAQDWNASIYIHIHYLSFLSTSSHLPHLLECRLSDNGKYSQETYLMRAVYIVRKANLLQPNSQDDTCRKLKVRWSKLNTVLHLTRLHVSITVSICEVWSGI